MSNLPDQPYLQQTWHSCLFVQRKGDVSCTGEIERECIIKWIHYSHKKKTKINCIKHWLSRLINNRLSLILPSNDHLWPSALYTWSHRQHSVDFAISVWEILHCALFSSSLISSDIVTTRDGIIKNLKILDPIPIQETGSLTIPWMIL